MAGFTLTNNTNNTNKPGLELSLADGIRLVGLLLRLGQIGPARKLARRLLIIYPQALPLHLGLGRVALADASEGRASEAEIQRGVGHLRRVLESDPENWRVRLELSLLYLLHEQPRIEPALQELWPVVQAAPRQKWLTQLFERLGQWPELKPALDYYINLNSVTELASTSSRRVARLEGQAGLAYRYLQRKLPWMAVQCFEAALRRTEPGESNDGRFDLKTGLLLAHWLNGAHEKAVGLAVSLLQEQPRLFMPRLMLASQLARQSFIRNPEVLTRLLIPVWQLDPFLERSGEIIEQAGLDLPTELWPPNGRPEYMADQVQLGLWSGDEAVNQDWLKELVRASQKAPGPTLAAEVSYRLNGLEDLYLQPDIRPKGFTPASGSTRSDRNFTQENNPMADPTGNVLSPELEQIAASLNRIEDLLYNKGPEKSASKPAKVPRARSRKAPGNQSASRAVPHGGVAGSPAGSRLAAKRAEAEQTKPAFSFGGGGSPNNIAAGGSRGTSGNLQMSTTLFVTSERSLINKYGRAGARKVLTAIEEVVEGDRRNGQPARLLVVDSPEMLRQNGFNRLDPVRADQPEQIRSLINAALPNLGNDDQNPADSVFIVGGPELIPMWRLQNPSFDSDREVLSDNPYGSHDQTYLLPERVLGRLPDESGGGPGPDFLLDRLRDLLARQQRQLLPHNIQANLPLRMMEAFLPQIARRGLASLDGVEPFEQQWLRTKMAGETPFLDRSQAGQLKPFFYSAAAWQASSELLQRCLSEQSKLVFSPPTSQSSLEASLLQRAKLLHFNLHGFRETSEWYGQAQTRRMVANPQLSSLPVAFSPRQTALMRSQGTVVFSEACYGGYLEGKAANESIALSFLNQGSSAFVGSTAISYGSAGPELACAGHLAYFFWRELLTGGQSFGRSLQLAKINYARERLAAGYPLSGDDAKTLLEFTLLGHPGEGLAGSRPVASKTLYGTGSGPAWQPNGTNLSKGGRVTGNYTWEREREEFSRLREQLSWLWEKVGAYGPRKRYQAVPYQKLPDDVQRRVLKALDWLLPDRNLSNEEVNLHAVIDTEYGYAARRNHRYQDFEQSLNWSSELLKRVFPKGGEEANNPDIFANWFDESPDQQSGSKETGGEIPALSGPQAGPILLTGQRSLKTVTGQHFQQTFHLTTDVTGDQIEIALSRGNG